MASTNKKTNLGSPKLKPRPTAASQARAARNAVNRVTPPVKSNSLRLPSPDHTRSKHMLLSQNDSAELKSSVRTINYSRTESKSTYQSDMNESTRRSDSKMNIEEDYTNQGSNDSSSIKYDGDKAEAKDSMHYNTNTPKDRSRSNTPNKDEETKSRPSTPRSRPNSGVFNSVKNKPSTKISQVHLTTGSTALEKTPSDDDLKAVLKKKQKEFHDIKKDLDLKQQEILVVFKVLREVEDRLKEEGGLPNDNDEPKNLLMFNVGDWPTDEISQLCHDAAEASRIDDAVDLLKNSKITDEKYLNEITNKINDMPSQFGDLFTQVFHASQEIIDWAKDAIHNELGGGEFSDKIELYSNQGQELFEALNGIKTYAHASLESATQFLKCTYYDRNALQTAAEALVREIAHLKAELKSRSNDTVECETDGQIRADLEEERGVKELLKDKLTKTENVLRLTKSRVAKMDKQLREAETSITSLTATVKTLEEQNRKSESQLEARARKMRESLKTGEEARNQLGQQRDALNAEIKHLKETIEKINEQNSKTVRELNDRLVEADGVIKEKSTQLDEALQSKQKTEEALQECQKEIETLNEKIAEYEKTKINPELPTEREMDLWAELQTTKESLRMTEEEVTMCKRDKVRFLETMSSTQENVDKMDMQQKLAAELISKEEIIAKMQSQIRDLSKNSKLNEQKLHQYQMYVKDLQVVNQNLQEKKDVVHVSAEYQELQQETIKLQMELLDSAHKMEEMQNLLLQKDQQIETQEKASRSQANCIKMRQELINLLKNKELEQTQELNALQRDLDHRMKIVDDVNKQIAAKADEIKELFATLETKQQQIHRLELIVMALENQQQRAQAQRVRNEEKIAALEHELASFGKRERYIA